jgi:hypothetical protein
MGVAMHQLNIKNAKAYKLATELRELTGESLATAVTVAVEERLEREKRKRGRKIEAMRRIVREYQEQFPGPLPTREEMDDYLYDENGLPR